MTAHGWGAVMNRQSTKARESALRYGMGQTRLRQVMLSPLLAAPYGPYKITKQTIVTIPVCPKDWATNNFAPFGSEAYKRAANQRDYVRRKFQRDCWFTRKDGVFYINFNVYHVAHKEIEWFKKVFFLDDQPTTFTEIGV